MNIIDELNKYIESSKEFVLATVVEATGSTPARAGFKMIISKDDFVGTVGGGSLEYKTVDQGREQLKERKSILKEYDLAEIGMTCGGCVKVFFEYMPGGKNLYIFGAGHVAQAVSPIANMLGFKVTVIDNRPEVATKENHPNAYKVICSDFKEYIESTTFPNNSYAIIVTNKHKFDGTVLNALCKIPEKFVYIGMIGSIHKIGLVMEDLKNNGVTDEQIEKIYTPIGLDIGGNSPAEIAVGIMAEIIAIEYKKPVPHMKNKWAGSKEK